MLLYHGSPENADKISVHEADGPFEIFDGVFASSYRDVALSHGKYIYTIEIQKDQILPSDRILDIEEDDRIPKIFEQIISHYDPEYCDVIYDALVWERYDQEDDYWRDLLCISDPAKVDWQLQNLRGRMAAALGYRAVEMHDEHGSSYLILPGNTLTREIPTQA